MAADLVALNIFLRLFFLYISQCAGGNRGARLTYISDPFRAGLLLVRGRAEQVGKEMVVKMVKSDDPENSVCVHGGWPWRSGWEAWGGGEAKIRPGNRAMSEEDRTNIENFA